MRIWLLLYLRLSIDTPHNLSNIGKTFFFASFLVFLIDKEVLISQFSRYVKVMITTIIFPTG
jgi:hypothetical protein